MDDFIISIFVILNVTLAMVITIPEYMDNPQLNLLSLIFTLIFLAEYVLKVWAAGSQPEYRSFKNRLVYALTGGRLLDAIIVFPPLLIWLYAHLGFTDTEFASSFRLFQLARLIHLLRVIKLGRTFEFSEKLARQLQKSWPLIVSSYLMLIVIAIIAASFMYFAENQAQPDVFSSLPKTLWWAFVTLSTIGYGDMYPVTAFGQLIGVAVILAGLAFYGVPIAIVGNAVQATIHTQEDKSTEDLLVKLSSEIAFLREEIQSLKKS
jgi:voltage-gated potassium channel